MLLGIRNRRGGTFGDTNDGDEDDLDSLIKAHHADQERTAEEMLSLTRFVTKNLPVKAQKIILSTWKNLQNVMIGSKSF